MKRDRSALTVVSLLLGVCSASTAARGVIKLLPGQEFLYSGVVEGKQTAGGQPVMTLTAPVKLRAIVARADPRQGCTVILIRSSKPQIGAGQRPFPDVAGVAIVRFGPDRKPHDW